MTRLLFLLASAGLAIGQVPHQQHPPHSADEYKHVLDHSTRDEWQKPHESVTALKLRPDEAVADIGSGTGYFSKRFAKHAAKVYAVDVDAKLLAGIAKDAPPNLTTILAAPDDPKLPAQSVDTIFFCNVLHHIDNRPAYYEKLTKALKPGGRIVVMEFHHRTLPVGPPPSMKIKEEDLVKELDQAGFKLDTRHDFLPHQYYLEFRRK